MNDFEKSILKEWFNTEFKQALLDDEQVLMAGAVLRVGVERGLEPIESLRRAVGSFVKELIEPAQ